jgi:hypothetical protein
VASKEARYSVMAAPFGAGTRPAWPATRYPDLVPG